MTDETSPTDVTGAEEEALAHPEIAAIADSLDEPEPAIEPTAEAAPEAEPEIEAQPVGEESPGEPASEEPASEESASEEPAGEEPAAAADSAAELVPGPVATTAPEALVAVADSHSPDTVSWWPFLVYLAIWVVFAGVIIWRFHAFPAGQAVYDSPDYALSVFGGIALTLAGPLLVLATWVASWGAPGSTKWGLFVDAMLKGSVVTLGGVAMWWIALLIVDQMRLGSVL